MPDKRMLDYITNSVRNGYTISQIRDTLSDAGYAQKDINKALDELGFGPEGKKTPAALRVVIIALSAFCMFMAAFLILSFTGFMDMVFQADMLRAVNICDAKGRNSCYLGSMPSDWSDYNINVDGYLRSCEHMMQCNNCYECMFSVKAGCVEDWSCTQWYPSQCPIEGVQVRKCTELNSCGTYSSRPEQIRNCTYIIPDFNCTEDWQCGAWSSCINDTVFRTCTDMNSCGTEFLKPKTTKPCQTNCTEDWNCTGWSACRNGFKKRNCTDLNSCGTVFDLPSLIQQCNGCSSSAECSDRNPCTVDLCNSSGICTHYPITACNNGDGCCPSGCTSESDGDCEPEADDWTEVRSFSGAFSVVNMAVFDGKLYAVVYGAYNSTIYSYDGISWTKTFETDVPINMLKPHNGNLYACTGSTAYGNVSKLYSSDGSSWELAIEIPSSSIQIMESYGPTLYLGAYSPPLTVYEFDGVGVFESIIPESSSSPSMFHSSEEYNNKLYMTTNSPFMLVYDGIGWSWDAESMWFDALGMHDGKLYASSGASVYIMEADEWVEIYSGFLGNQDITDFASFNGVLYAASGASDGKVIKYDGSEWKLSWDPDESTVTTLVEYDGNLYASGIDSGKIYMLG
ncbi:MAG: hypothetical protein DRO99_01135 [Candidatus Aenigmatarchaeota archaeon]|nr:MAG: hypothetical protein DRO99_01135 [Candidatus Aenigmarchaeota archaeon]